MTPHRLLIVTHGLGGGVERYVGDLAELLSGDAGVVEVLRAHQDGSIHLSGADDQVLQEWRDATWASVVDGLRERAYKALVICHVAGFPANVLNLPEVLGKPFLVVVHDFYPYCPQYSLIDSREAYCGEPDESGCAACVAQRPHAWAMPILQWRAAMRRLLQAASAVIVPSGYVETRIRKHFPAAQIHLLPHPPRHEWLDQEASRIKVLLIGALSPRKGLHVLYEVAELVRVQALPLRFVVAGFVSEPIPEAIAALVEIRGEYQDQRLPEVVSLERPDLIWLPGQIPESYSYVLDAALASGVAVVGPNFGAVGERLQGIEHAFLVPFNAAATIWLDALGQAVAFNGRVEPSAEQRTARSQYRSRFLEFLRREPNWDPDPVAQVPDRVMAARPSPERSLANLFMHGVLCGHRASLNALGARLAEVDRDIELLSSYSRQRDMPWYEQLSRFNPEELAWLRSEHERNARELSEALARCATAEAAVQHALAEAAELTAQLDEEKEAQAALTRQLAAANGRIADLESSTSWRVTVPLRWLGRKVAGARQRLAPYGYRWIYARQRLRNVATVYREQGGGEVMRRAWRKLEADVPSPRPESAPNLKELSAPGPLLLATIRPEGRPNVSIVIPAYENHRYTFSTLCSIGTHTRLDAVEIIVVDDASPTPVADALREVRGVRFLRAETNGGFIASCHLGADAARGEFIVLLNNDVNVTAGWLEALLEVFEGRADAGLVGAKLLFLDGKLQEAGGIVWRDGSAWNWGRGQDPGHPAYNYLRAVDYCSGACLALRRTDWLALGGFNRHYAPAYYEDTDFAFQIRAMGKQVYYQPAAEVIHFEGVSSGTDLSQGVKRYQIVNQEKFFARWRQTLTAHAANGCTPWREADRLARRRILVIEACMLTPNQDSGSVRMLAMLEQLLALGCQVSFIADNLELREPYGSQLRRLGVEVWHHPYVRSVGELVERIGARLDAIIICRHYIASNHLAAIRRHAPQAKVVFDTVDLHYLRELRQAELAGDEGLRATALKTRAQEFAMIAACDATLVVSPVEQKTLADEMPDAVVEIVSNIHTTRGGGKAFAEREGLLFVGGFRHPPNVDAVKWFVAEVWPLVRQKLPTIEFCVVGSNMPPEIAGLQAEGVRILGFVDSVKPLLDDARVSVAPLRYGAGVKGKINEAMACGLPVVSTSIGTEGMFLVDGEDVLLADDPVQFAEAIYRLYTDQPLWERIASYGLRNVERNFSPTAARAVLARLLGLDAGVRNAKVDVIVPVFNAGVLARRCIESVIAAKNHVDFELVVIDDASSEADLIEWLDQLASGGTIKLLRNAENLGFVASVNRGMLLHATADVVLLNSDTEVADGWLDRLVASAESQGRVATVTPWSNNATICSWPDWPEGGELPADVDWRDYDRLARTHCAGRRAWLPTAVGFCMYIRRAALDAVGVFDAAAFGRGYGEENDFCLRASAAGFVHLLAADTYVYHRGHASFGEGNGELKRQAAAVLEQRWPDYAARIDGFIRRDPLAPLRALMDRR